MTNSPECLSTSTDRERSWHRPLAILLLVAASAAAFIGRGVISADGIEVVAVTLGFFVDGKFEAAMPPTADLLPVPPFSSHYGIFPSFLPVPFLAPAWPFRTQLGARGLDAFIASTWAAGAIAAAWSFYRFSRRLCPGLSPLWAPAFLTGTFLWPYSADSFFDPWAATALTLGAEGLLSHTSLRPHPARLLFTAILFCTAAWLRPILWITAPAYFLAAVLMWKDREDGSRNILFSGLGLASSFVVALVANTVQNGSPLHFGYQLTSSLPFSTPLLTGVWGSLFSPGRGLVFYAPLTVLSFFVLRKLRPEIRALSFATSALVLLVSAQWFIWHGGSCWGPRYLLPVLPLLAAPAVLGPRIVSGLLLAAGFCLNAPGVVVATGAWMSHVEMLVPPPSASWPKPGPARVSEIASLSPLLGHPWLLVESIRPGLLAPPWTHLGAVSQIPAPQPDEFLSPLFLRTALGLAPVSPFSVRILERTAAAYIIRGRPESAIPFAEEAVRIEPRSGAARLLLGEARRLAGKENAR